MTRVAVVATGGTIASTASAGGVVASRAAADLLGSTHVTDIDVETVDLMTVGSYRMNLGHIRLISDAVADLLARETDPIDGIVITHGTDTTEETAVLLDLVHDDPRPVVLTGAQRASDAADGDGPRNLADAILVAASPRARGLGVLIAFAGRVLPARGTRKVHTAAPQPVAAALLDVRSHPGRFGRDVSRRRRRLDESCSCGRRPRHRRGGHRDRQRQSGGCRCGARHGRRRRGRRVVDAGSRGSGGRCVRRWWRR